MENQNRYWAAAPSGEIADEILGKVDKYYQYVTLSGRAGLWKRSYAYYYRPRITGARLNPVGEQGELTALSVNHYRNLILHLVNIITQQKVDYQTKAANTDVESIAQCDLASSLLSYYLAVKRMERNLVDAVEQSLVFSEAFVRAEWDATGGETYGQTETGAVIYEGDVKYSNYTPFDVIRDFSLTAASKGQWVILRDFENKYDLIAKFPDLEERIINNSLDQLKVAATTNINIAAMEESDSIAVYTFLHPPTPALKNGRFTRCLDNGTVLQDGPIPYRSTYVYRIVPNEEIGSIFGFTVGFDLLPIQESLDILYSTVITNQSTCGIQNIIVPKGHDLSVSQIAGGMNLLECDLKLGVPQTLQLTNTAPEIFGFMQTLERLAETISGIDSLTRGNADQAMKAGMSGSALALIQSMAIQFSAGLQRSYTKIAEDIGMATIELLQVFAAVPRVAEIVGKSKRALMKEFSGKDLSAVKRVIVDIGNPIMGTISGKMNMADLLFEKGMIENPDQYLQVLSTGRLEPAIEGKQAQLLLIKAENEGLSQGQPQRVLITDNHQKHILEHSVIASNPEIRQDSNSPVLEVTLDHILEHMQMANDPTAQWLMAALHQEQLPPLPVPSMGGEVPMPGIPAQAQAASVNMPQMPNAPQGTDTASQEAIAQQELSAPF